MTATSSGIRGLADGVRQHLGREVTVRDLAAHRATLLQGPRFVGTPERVADLMEEWFTTRGCDGFVLAATHLPGAFEEFVRMVVPVLQERGLFRRGYTRDHAARPPRRRPARAARGRLIRQGPSTREGPLRPRDPAAPAGSSAPARAGPPYGTVSGGDGTRDRGGDEGGCGVVRAGGRAGARAGYGRRRRWWLWVAWPLVVSAVLAIEWSLLHERIEADVALLLSSGRDTAAAPAPGPVLPPLPAAPAPATAGAVGTVDLRTVRTCGTGQDCLVRIHVGLRPASGPTTVDWTVRLDDLCGGTGGTVASGTVDVPAGADRADVVAAVRVPDAAATALTAVTAGPGTAASPAVRVPPTGGCTP
ncbi:hypothetical protein LWC35_16165 [Pseudonocardia kujensis]|uniref:hypothetical protein n=1 Tax=Pseudonocardia kujensis TaxID=1128675 RepID=UPI001E44BC29|nr:hypothetical protein [Pseudonocardia kujensis]MCE0764430.1 hypothetical protein [Pseudonocardia kujensis]